MYGHHSHIAEYLLVVSSTRKLSVLAQCRCIRGRYIYMYLYSTVLLFVFVDIPGMYLLIYLETCTCVT